MTKGKFYTLVRGKPRHPDCVQVEGYLDKTRKLGIYRNKVGNWQMVDLNTGLGVRAEGFGTRASAEEFLDAGQATVESVRKSDPNRYRQLMADYKKSVAEAVAFVAETADGKCLGENTTP